MSFALTTAETITREIDTIIEEICPGAGRRPMYGGIVFERQAGNHQTMVCGHFIYKSHVSLEFSNGYLLEDPDGVLEGKGKYRRHIKLTESSEVAGKPVRAMLEQAFSQ